MNTGDRMCNCNCHIPGMTTTRNCCGCRIQFTTPDSFVGANYHNSLENLITHAREGIEKCLEHIEQIEGGFSTFKEGINRNIGKLQERIYETEDFTKRQIPWNQHINERLMVCEKQLIVLTDMYKNLTVETAAMHDHKIRQIDENRKLSARVDELEKVLRETLETNKKPYKCPICEGSGYWKAIENGIVCGGQCKTCNTTGVLWG